jgi:hypothetical protein
MPLGTIADKVSTREQLLKERVTSGAGAPTHTPEVDAQDYYDKDNLTKLYVWRKGAWSAVISLA